jgi:hypothetical protein
MTQIPDEVYVIGLIRPAGEGRCPIEDEDTGVGVSPLAVEDADGERAVPTFTTQARASWGVNRFMSKKDREQSALCIARVGLGSLLETLSRAPEGVPKVDYIGINMGDGGAYPLIRL